MSMYSRKRAVAGPDLDLGTTGQPGTPAVGHRGLVRGAPRWKHSTCGLLLGSLCMVSARAELLLDACVDALRKAPPKVVCNAAYRTTTATEIALLSKLSYGLVQKTTCELEIGFDLTSMAGQYRARSGLKPDPVQLSCVMETPAARLPIKVVAKTQVNLTAQGTADAFVAETITVSGFSNVYEGQILRFVNENEDLRKDVLRIFNENMKAFSGQKYPENSQKDVRSAHEQLVQK